MGVKKKKKTIDEQTKKEKKGNCLRRAKKTNKLPHLFFGAASHVYISADNFYFSIDTLILQHTGCLGCDVGWSGGDCQFVWEQDGGGVSYRDVCAILMYTEKPRFLS